ncbi:hypothetical protein NC661_00405 [Aquibacillus koreensis]|uniref:Uncharacterized protein n=1 Tax=Aquibacillus koreensis TaxID=279446 RepID=A0A9X3WI11_9BACI|nr:hypothetical protein [Aquibacillus koreensis]MCT2537399.1 hypothetical protein [Aquibacillus koreensis]MDC3418845.1 hypothetical protein [Aquibacillus koreensis]
MDGLIFLWVSWLIWIMITFFMGKDNKRTQLACWILLIIISAGITFTVSSITFSATVSVLYIGALFVLAKSKDWLLQTMKCVCLVFGYAGLLFWEQISPIWLFAPRLLIITVLGFIILQFLSASFFERCMIWCLGVTTGEIIHGLILNSYGLRESIGDLAFMDVLFIEISFLIIAQFLKELRLRIEILTQMIEKQKKRWTHE